METNLHDLFRERQWLVENESASCLYLMKGRRVGLYSKNDDIVRRYITRSHAFESRKFRDFPNVFLSRLFLFFFFLSF